MLEPTKEHHIEARFKGPPEKILELTRFARTLGLDEPADSLPWRDLFTDFDDEPTYGVALRGARGKEGLTQKELAQKTGIPQSHISSMENGRMTIGRERARRLAKALRVDYRIFL
ncbi:MAG: XRE family transcriptional regulator [Desulfobacteraceae bacterium]|jgi:DNA-binding XRE family transcriptional regulator|nr:MAG: XRE family transcriptional regulator [Desulfobacteraceae bacterium]